MLLYVPGTTGHLMIANETEIASLNETNNEYMSTDDASWILGNAFILLTMQSGFGLLEAGSVSSKNAASIMVKNMVDVTLGGCAYWAFGYGLSFGEPSTRFFGMGDFFVQSDDVTRMGSLYTKYVFQFSFSTAATTIVSGAIAGRMKLTSYMAFSVLNTIIYSFPVHWVWHRYGFLKQLGFYDWAGSCVVHVTGGVSALVGTYMLGPRLGRFGSGDVYQMSSPVTALTGTFMLWWAWLGLNCGSTFGIEDTRWKTAAKSGLNTINGSIGGGIVGLILSAIMHKGRFDIGYLIISVLSGLVSVTGCCSVIEPTIALALGSLGASAAIFVSNLMNHFAFLDDPARAVPLHLGGGVIGTLAVGFVIKEDFLNQTAGYTGLVYGGGFYLIGVQILGIIIIGLWSAVCTTICFYAMDKTIGLRVTPEQEILGADWVEHGVRDVGFVQKLEDAFGRFDTGGDAVEELMKKLMIEIDESGAIHGNSERRIVRQLSPAEQTNFDVAIAVGQLLQTQDTDNAHMGMPTTRLEVENNGNLSALIGAAVSRDCRSPSASSARSFAERKGSIVHHGDTRKLTQQNEIKDPIVATSEVENVGFVCKLEEVISRLDTLEKMVEKLTIEVGVSDDYHKSDRQNIVRRTSDREQNQCNGSAGVGQLLLGQDANHGLMHMPSTRVEVANNDSLSALIESAVRSGRRAVSASPSTQSFLQRAGRKTSVQLQRFTHEGGAEGGEARQNEANDTIVIEWTGSNGSVHL